MSSWELYETSPNKLTNKVLGKNLELNFFTYSFSILLPPFYSISELQRKLVSFPGACPQTSQQGRDVQVCHTKTPHPKNSPFILSPTTTTAKSLKRPWVEDVLNCSIILLWYIVIYTSVYIYIYIYIYTH